MAFQTPLLNDQYESDRLESGLRLPEPSRSGKASGVIFQTQDLSFEVSDRQILHKLTASFGPNKLIAVMGASGAGKTTLLNIMAGTTRGPGVSGSLFLNGDIVDWRVMRKNSAYVLQDDLLLPNLTPREALWDVAQLRLSDKPVRQRVEKVDQMLRMFGLEAAADVTTGSPGVPGGLSGGQRKRLCVALEMMASPKLIFLDEPTSGLDAASAHTLIEQLRAAAELGHTIITTIHQPTSKLFQMFHEVMLLARGDIVYHGPVADVVPFFEKQGIKCPAYYNPADFLIEVADEQPGQVLSKIVGQYKRDMSERKVDLPESVQYPGQRYPIEFWPMTTILLKRAFRSMIRDKVSTRFRFVSHIMAGILTGLLWLNNDMSHIQTWQVASHVQNRIALMFFALIFVVLNSVIPTVLTFPATRVVFQKEHRNNWYSVRSYFLAQTIADIPFQVVLPLVYGGLVYSIVGLRGGGGHVLEFLFILILQTLVGQSLGVFVSCVAPTAMFAVFAAPVAIVPQLLLCGFLANLHQMPSVLTWLQYVSFIRYSLEGLVITQFRDFTITCSDQMGAECFNGNQAIHDLTFNGDRYPVDCLVLMAFALFFRVAAYAVLRAKVKKVHPSTK